MIPLINCNQSRNKCFSFYINDLTYSLHYKLREEYGIELHEIEVSKGEKQQDIVNALIERVLNYLCQTNLDIFCFDREIQSFAQGRPEFKNKLIYE